MTTTPSFIDDCPDVREWARRRGFSLAYAYKLIDAGMPVFDVPGLKKRIHDPTADAWLKANVRSKRKSKPKTRNARKIAQESAINEKPTPPNGGC